MKSQFFSKKYALVVANGDCPSGRVFKQIVDKSNVIVAADGGGNTLARREVTPDVILGDMDSVRPAVLSQFEKAAVKIIKYESQQENDLEKSIRYLMDEGYQNIVLTGIQGNRLDHSFAALELLKKYKTGANLYIITDHFEIFLIRPGNHTILTEPMAVFSIFGFSRGYNISTDKLKYPLKNENLSEGSRGVSNLSQTDKVSISFTKGNLLIFRSLRGNGTD